MINREKVEKAVSLLRRYEDTALNMNPDGYHVAFSGGKDSQVIYDLVKKAGVKHKVIYNVTTVDPPQLIKFIKTNYKDVIFKKPVMTMAELIKNEGYLPLRNSRYCCRYLKERTHTEPTVIITGVRKYESFKRAKQKEIQHNCIKGIDVLHVKPIFNWTNSEVWDYVRREIKIYCELYDKGFHRLGCVFCPFGSPKMHNKERLYFPKIEKYYLEAIKYIMIHGSYDNMKDENEVFKAWISGKKFSYTTGMRGQFNLNLF